MADILQAKDSEEFKDCVDEDTSVSTFVTDEPRTKPELDEASLDQLHELSLSDKDGQIHPSLQLVSTALMQGYISSELTDVVPVPKVNKKPETSKDDTAKQIVGESKNANTIIINAVDLKSIGENTLKPREQEKEDEAVLTGLRHLFNNRFMSAKSLFEQRADRDPLYALALSSMAFLKAVMTSNEQDSAMALNVLNTTFSIAKAQIDAAKKTSKVSGYFSGYYNYLKRDKNQNNQSNPPSNGVLRAHVVKAECCLLIAVLQLLQESIMGYIKCGLNLRRAYSSYNFVWQKYKALESNHAAFMDSDTVSGVQFGIGSVHLVLSALPAKILKAISAFGWKPDKQLGFSLLNICVESKRVRSPMATVMLLAYYSAAMSFAPQILCDAYTKTAMETLLEAQRCYPNAALYLFFAGRISRLGLDLPLSTQSYLYAAEMTKNDWAEIPVANACKYEIAVNHMITGNWEQAASTFEHLYQQKYWSAAFCKYMQGACLEMMGNRTDAILAFAEVPSLVVKKLGGRMSDIETYVLRKVQTFQGSGYQDLDFYTPALEFMCIWNLLHYMDKAKLEESRKKVEQALSAVAAREKEEYDIRSQELAPETPPPDHFDKRAALFLIKAALQNAVGVAADNTVILNWIIDHKESFSSDPWVIPYAFWEAGVTCWQAGLKNRSYHLWNLALGHSSYDFEYRLAVRLNLALSYAEEQGFSDPIPQPTDDKKRFSISLSPK